MTADSPSFFDTQYLGEVKKYVYDFALLSPGASVAASGASGSFAQSFGYTGGSLPGSAGSCAVSASAGSVTLTAPVLTQTGSYTFTAAATLSDGQTREVVWYVRADR